MKFDEVAQSKSFSRAIKILAGVIILALVFAAGLVIGLEKARFSYSWGESYYRMFAGPSRFYLDRDYLDAHGAVGKVLKIFGTTVVIKNDDGVEKNILTDNSTIILLGPRHIPVGDLTTDDSIVAIGKPDNQGQIQAVLIRVANGQAPPPPPGMMP